MALGFQNQSSAPKRRVGDFLFARMTQICALFLLITIIAMGWQLTLSALPAIREFGWGFLSANQWDPVTGQFGAAASLWGTLISSAIALLIAVPVSLGVAIFLTQLAPEFLRRPIGLAVELLAAIPSIIYGFWGLFVLSPWLATYIQPWLTASFGQLPMIGMLFQGPPMGIGLFSAGLVLSIMVIPFMASILTDLFNSVPTELKEASYGVGSTRFEMITKVVIPFAKVGIVGSFMLGLGRALGETMAVTFVIGNTHQLSAEIFSPGTTIASTLANEFSEASGGLYISSLLYLGLVLFLLTFVVLICARLMLWRLSNSARGKR
ncbi:Phosphate ABC transporter, permease protein [gamma proteobacterium HdN1]|nr:Phosphate ABC transporter, permease protein [gamma proteobacterium HdN1]